MQKFYAPAFILFLLGLSAPLFSQQWGYATLIPRAGANSVQLLDTNSVVIKQWSNLSGGNGYSSYLTEGGVLWRTVRASSVSLNGGGVCGRIQKIAWDGTVLFDYTVSDATQVSHHDICPMPNGNVILIVYELKTAAQVQAAGATANAVRWTEKLVELKPTGPTTAQIVWQWNLWDHLVQNLYPTKANYQTSIVNHPELLNINYKNTGSNPDWVHMNGIDYNAALDQIVVSSHNLNEMWVIDHSTTTAQAASHTGGRHGKGGDFLYRWGNPAAYGATGTAVFNVMHDAHWVPDDCPRAGWLGAFNNRGVSNTQSAVDLFQPAWNGTTYTYTPGQAYQPATYGYRHAATGYTSNMGSSQQLPNGNMLICLATAGRVYEIDPAGNTLWTYTATSSVAQSKRYSRCFIENPKITVATANPAICSGGSTQLDISVSATNTTNFSYAWDGGSGIANPSVQDPTISGITANTVYTVTVTTSPGCTVTASIPVTVSTPVADAGADVQIVAGQSTTLTATGGNTYLWSTGEMTAKITVSPTVTTTYTVTTTNANGCTATDAVLVKVTPPLTVQAAAANSAFCLGGNTQLSASALGGSGNLMYAWSSSPAGFSSDLQNPTVAPTANTTYFVTVSDGANTATASVVVTVHPLPIAHAGNDVRIFEGQNTILSATGGSSYIWNTGANTANITVAPSTLTTYTVTVTNANGCTADDAVVVSVLPKVAVSASAEQTAFCSGGITQLLASAVNGTGNFTYAWSSQPAGFTSDLKNPTVAPTVNTTYFLTVNDGVGTATATVAITVFPLPTADAGSDKTILFGQSAELTATGGAGFNWSTGETTAQIAVKPSTTTTYSVTVTSASGCSASDEVTVVVTGAPLVAVANVPKNPICAGEAVELAATALGGSGNFTYEWSANGVVFSNENRVMVGPAATTTYRLMVNDGIGTATTDVTLNVLPLPIANAGSNQSILIGTAANLTASGGDSYHWSTGESTASIRVSPLATTTYTVTATSANGCTASDAVVVEVTGTFVSAVPTASASEICAGAITQLFANPTGGTGNYDVEWLVGGSVFSKEQNPNIQPAATTTYVLRVADGIRVFETDLKIVVNPLPAADAGSDQTILEGSSATLTASGGTVYQWSTGENTASIRVSPQNTTTYSVTVTDAKGCSASDEMTVTVVDYIPLVGSVSATQTAICIGDALQLFATANNGTGQYQFTWTSNPAGFSSTLPDPFVNPEETTTYSVRISDGVSNVVRSVEIVVNPLPQQPTVSLSGITLTSSSPTNNQWFYYGNPIAGATGQTFQPTFDGSYQVQVSNANGCLSPLSDPIEVIIRPLVVAVSTSNAAICLGDVAQLLASPSGGSGTYTYSWTSDPAGFTSTLPDPFVNPEETTTYSVRISDGINSVVGNVKITVNPLPQQPTVSLSGITLTSSSPSNNQWFYYGNPIAGATGQTFKPTITGSYQVQIVNANGCLSPLSDPVEVIILPLTVAVSTTDAAICLGDVTQLLASPSGGLGNYTYSWTSDPAGFTSTLPDPFINPEQTTTYTVRISDGVNSVESSIKITVNPLPQQPTVSLSGTTLTSSSPTNNQWFYYGNPIAGATGQAFQPTITGSYQVQIVNANGCLSPLSDPIEVIIVSAHEAQGAEKWSLAPNPAADFVQLLGDFGGKSFSVTIFDAAGALVLRERNTPLIAVSDLAPGIYSVRLEAVFGVSVKKLVVLR